MGKIVIIFLSYFFTTVTFSSTQHSLHIPLHANKISLDPSTVQDFSSLWVSRQINCQLVRVNGGVLVMEAAKAIRYLSPIVIEIQLKPDVKFSDGSFLTSEDVVATFNYLRAKRVVLRNTFHWIKKVESFGPSLIRITLNKEIPQFLKVLSSPNYAMFKKDFILKASHDSSRWNNPVGCGNYHIRSNSDSVLELMPTKEGLPVNFHLIHDSQVSQNQIPNYDIIPLKVVGDSGQINGYHAVTLFDPYQFYLIPNVRVSPWNNRIQRCALFAVLNPDQIVNAYQGDVKKANDYLPPGTIGYDDDANFVNEIKKKYVGNKIPEIKKYRVSYLQSSIEESYRGYYLRMMQAIYPNASYTLLGKSGDMTKTFAATNNDAVILALKSNYLDGYEYLLLFSEKGINLSGYEDQKLAQKIKDSQLIEDPVRRKKEYRSIISNIKDLCLAYPLFTKLYETTYIKNNIDAPGFGKGPINEYYLGRVIIK